MEKEQNEAEVIEQENEITSEGQDEAEDGSEDNGSDGEQESTDEPDLTTEEGRKAFETKIRKDQDKRWKDRIKKGGKEGEKGSEKNNKEVKIDERWVRTDLKAEGIKDAKEQDIVLDYIKEQAERGREVAPEEALKSRVVKEDLENHRVKQSTPSPSNRTSAGKPDSFEYWKKEAKKGNFPRHDRAMMKRLEKARIWSK